MWGTVKNFLFASFETSWRIEGPANSNMQLMRELAKQNSFEILMDEESQIGFICRVWSLPILYSISSFEKITCTLKQVTPHRCYLTVKFITAKVIVIGFFTLWAFGFAFAAYVEKEFFYLLFIPLSYAVGTRFGYLTQ